MSERIVVEVTAFEALPQGDSGSRRALVRWSDGSTGEALRWYDDLCGHPHKSSYAESLVMPMCPVVARPPVSACARRSPYWH